MHKAQDTRNFPVPGPRSPITGSRFSIPGPRFSVPDSRFPILDPRSPVPGPRSPITGSRFSVPVSRFPVTGHRSPISGSRSPILFIFLALLLLPSLSDAAISYIYPSPKSWVKRSDYLIVKLNNLEITGVTITVNGIESDLLRVSSPEYRKTFQDFLIVRPVWDRGKNSIVIDAYSGDKKIETATNDIFFNPAMDPIIPDGYLPNVVHTPAIEMLCAPCHNMKPTIEQFEGAPKEGNPCYTCHKSMMNVSFVHGPAGTYTCVYCHALQGEPKYSVKKRDAESCTECHADKAEEFKKRKYLHGPIDAGLCEVCHDPHGSPYPAQLRMAVNDLCLSCHDKIANEAHATRTPSGKGHPLKAKEDLNPQRKGKEFTCVSCHLPHAADVRYYYRSNEEEKMRLCQLCHNY